MATENFIKLSFNSVIDGTAEIEKQVAKFTKELSEKYKLSIGYDQSSLKSLAKQVEEIQSKMNNFSNDGIDKQNRKIQEQIELFKKSKEIQMQNMESQYGDIFNTKNIQRQLSEYKSALNGLDVSNFATKSKETNLQLKQIDANLKTVKTSQKGVFTDILHDLGKMAEWTVAGGLIFGTINQIKQAIEFTNQLNKSMTNIQMITGMSHDNIVNLTSDYSNLARQLHETVSGVMEASEEFLRAGRNQQETETMLKASTVMSKISGQDQKTTADQLIAITNGYEKAGMKISDVMGVVDKLTTVDNMSATSTAELGTALERTGTSAQMAGTSFDNLVSYIATVSSISRKSASSIGESFKTIFARYQDVKGGKNFDYENEDISNVERDFNRYAQLHIRDTAGSFKDFDVIISELSKKWSTLNEVEQSGVAKALAGTRQRENFLILMNNMNKALGLQKAETDSAGSAMNRYGVFAESTEAKINDLKNSLQQLWMEVVHSETINNAINLLTSFIKELDKLQGKTSILKNIFSVGGILSGVGGFAFGKTLGTDITKGITEKLMGGTIKTALGKMAGSLAGSFLSPVIGTLIGALLGTAIDAAIKQFNPQEKIKQATSAISEYDNEIKEVNQKQTDFNNLYKEYESLMSKSNAYGLNIEEKKHLVEVSQQLVDKYGLEVDGIDTLTGAYNISTDAANKYTQALKNQTIELEKNQSKERDKRINSNIQSANQEINPTDIDSIIENVKKYRDVVNEISKTTDSPEYNKEYQEAISYLGNISKQYGVDVKQALSNFGNDNNLDELKSELIESSQKYRGYIGQVSKDLLTNINVDLNNIVDENSQNFLNMVLSQYFSSENVDWNIIKSNDFTQKVKDFATEYQSAISQTMKDVQKYQSKESEGSLSFTGYGEYYSALQSQAGIIQEMANKGIISAEQAQKQIGQITSNISKDIGLSMSDIAKNLGIDGGKFKTLAESIVSVDNAFKNGKVGINEYFTTLNNNLKNVDFSSVFGSNMESAQEFITTMSEKSATMLSDVMSQFETGKTTVSDFTKQLVDLAPMFETLSEKTLNSADSLGINDEATNQLSEDTQVANQSITDGIGVLNNIASANTATTEIVSGNAQSGTQAYADSMRTIADYLASTVGKSDAGFQDIQGNALHSSNEIYNALVSDTANFGLAQNALATDTNNGVSKIAQGIGKIISDIGQDIQNFKASINFTPSLDFSNVLTYDESGVHFQFPSIKFAINGQTNMSNTIGQDLMNFGNLVSSYSPNINASKYMVKPTSTGGGSSLSGNSYIPSGGDNSKNKGSSSSPYRSETDANEALVEKDRYYEIQNKILDKENEINKVKSEQDELNSDEVANAEHLKELYTNEISILKEKQGLLKNLNDERRTERNEILSTLSKYGITSSGEGDDVTLDNYQDVLNGKIDYVNSLRSSKDKTAYTNAKDELTDLQTAVKRFFEIQLTDIPKTSEEWFKLNKDINTAGDSIEKINNEVYKDRINDLEHEIYLIQQTGNESQVSADKVIENYRKIQEEAHNRADELRKQGKDDNSSEIQEIQKAWWDAENSAKDFQEKRIGELKDAATDMLSEQKDLLDKHRTTEEDYWNKRIDNLKKSREEQQKEVDLIKLKQALENAQNEKTKRVWVEGQGWTYQADQNAIDTAKKNLDDAQFDKKISDMEKQRDKALQPYDRQIKEVEHMENLWKKITDKMDKESKTSLLQSILGDNWQTDLPNAVKLFSEFVTQHEKLYGVSKISPTVTMPTSSTAQTAQPVGSNILGLISGLVTPALLANGNVAMGIMSGLVPRFNMPTINNSSSSNGGNTTIQNLNVEVKQMNNLKEFNQMLDSVERVYKPKK